MLLRAFTLSMYRQLGKSLIGIDTFQHAGWRAVKLKYPDSFDIFQSIHRRKILQKRSGCAHQLVVITRELNPKDDFLRTSIQSEPYHERLYGHGRA